MTKVKISITVSRDLLERIDRVAGGSDTNRSAVIESWLRLADRSRAEEILRERTIEYYGSLDDAKRAEDAALSRAVGRQARRIDYDE